MPIFDLQAPDGKTYEVDAPDAGTAVSGFKMAMGIGEQNAGKGTRDQREPASMDRASDIATRAGYLRQTLGDTKVAADSGVPFSDELGALVGAPRGLFNGHGMGEEYQREMEAQAQARAGVAQDHPIMSPVVSGLTGLATLGGPGSAAMTLPQTAGQLAKTGAIVGGVSGLAEGQGTDRLGNAAIGGAIGGTLGAGAGKFADWLAGRSGGAGQQVVQAADRLGMTLPKIAASDNKAVQMAGQGIAGTFAGTPIPRALQGANEALGVKAEQLAQGLGQAGDKANVGAGMSQALKDYIEKVSPGRVKAAYDRVDTLVNPAVTTDLAATAGKAQDIATRRAAATLKGEGAASNLVLDAATKPGGLTYPGIKDLRTNMGEKLKGGLLPEDFSGAEAKQLYGSLSEDLGSSVANAGGPDALRAWQVANRYARMSAAKNERLAAMIGNKSDEQLFNSVLGAARTGGAENARLLSQVKASVPANQWNEVGSAFVAGMGRDPASNAFSPARFMTDYAKLSDTGRAALFNPRLTAALDDMATVATRLKTLDKLANYSRTGNVASATAFGGGLMAAPMTTLTTALGTHAMARLMARPAAVRAITQIAQAGSRGRLTPGVVRITAATLARELGQRDVAKQIEMALLQPNQ